MVGATAVFAAPVLLNDNKVLTKLTTEGWRTLFKF